MLLGFSFVSYVERVNISIAAELMMPALSMSKIEMGQIFTSFLVGYAIFQVPLGMLGDTIGPRLTLTLAALFWGITTALTGFVPGVIVQGAAGIFSSLWILRFLLGSAEAATYPVAARSVRNWMPAPQRAFGNSVMLTGSPLATAATAPVVSWLMVRFGWRESFYITSSLAFLIAVLWYWYSTDEPGEHPHVSRSELALIRADGTVPAPSTTPVRVWKLMADRRVLFLSLSYVCEGYVLFIFVFWLYIYLVDVRGFSILKGGIVTGLPWLTAVALTPVGGLMCDRLSALNGRLAGARVVIMLGYGLTGSMLFVAAGSSHRTLVVATLCLSVGFLMFCEPAFWSTAVYLGGTNAGAISGLMNSAAIVGGIVSTSLMPVLVKQFGWLVALSSGACVAICCTALWWKLGHESKVNQPSEHESVCS
jgi:MFS transporter, ACS family, glucarate transporter